MGKTWRDARQLKNGTAVILGVGTDLTDGEPCAQTAKGSALIQARQLVELSVEISSWGACNIIPRLGRYKHI